MDNDGRQLRLLPISALKEWLRELRLPVTGPKAVLIERLRAGLEARREREQAPNAQRTPAPTGNSQGQPSQATQPSAERPAAPPGNLQLAAALAGLYGSELGADCTVVFCQEAEQECQEAEQAKEGRKRGREADEAEDPLEPLGDPLSGHTLVLRNVSERFAAQVGRGWSAGLSSKRPQLRAAALRAMTAKKSSRIEKSAAPSATSSRPVLRVPLGSEAELPAARLALRFAYTGEVGGLGSIREALEVRRIGDYLAIEGCAAACAKWVSDKLAEPVPQAGPSGAAGSGAAGSGAAGSGPSGSAAAEPAAAEPAAAEPPVLQLLGCAELWPSDDPSFASVLKAARPQMLQHFGSVLAILNTPSLRRQLEVLLESDDLATDSEDSVLTLLAVWMKANWEDTDADDRKRLAGLVRLARLSAKAASCLLLPLAADYEAEGEDSQAGWFPVDVMEAAYVLSYVAASTAQREGLREHPVEGVQAGWLSTSPRRQCIPVSGLTYNWSISKEALTAALQKKEPSNDDSDDDKAAEPDASCYAYPVFEGGTKVVMARGLAWSPIVEYTPGADAAGIYLDCSVPAAYRVEGSRLAEATSKFSSTINARLVVHRWRSGAREVAHSETYDRGSGTTVGWSWGSESALPLGHQPAAEAAASGAPLACWAQYLGPDNTVTGSLTLLPPS